MNKTMIVHKASLSAFGSLLKNSKPVRLESIIAKNIPRICGIKSQIGTSSLKRIVTALPDGI